MNWPQPSFIVRVDETNPGQVLACGGLLELAHRSFPHKSVEGWFVDGEFCVAVSGHGTDAFDRIFAGLLGTKIQGDATRGDDKTRPVRLVAFDITLDWWIDDGGKKTPLKLWAGQQTSLKIVNDLRDALARPPSVVAVSLFHTPKPLTGRFGVDPRAAWNALDVGFSPNEQEMEVATYPAVELLAAIGLERFRPAEEGEERDACFRYATWSIPLPPLVACAASAGLLPGSGGRTYRFRIVERGSYKGFDHAIPIGGDA